LDIYYLRQTQKDRQKTSKLQLNAIEGQIQLGLIPACKGGSMHFSLYVYASDDC